ncbi:uncharacterized protein LOC120517918 [Polypterus senegalus]|uniref:uncharacterized protein LOC120517918 n=1 Tax=Polypterus senegalus TaxID=55291 RepID=UPI001963BD75|nr:uncharacterized protein LOC120517918 [Polypterus senegalus]
MLLSLCFYLRKGLHSTYPRMQRSTFSSMFTFIVLCWEVWEGSHGFQNDTLFVHGHLNVTPGSLPKPKISANASIFHNSSGVTITLDCHFENEHWPTNYTWFKLDPKTGDHTKVSEGATFQFSTTDLGGNDSYICSAMTLKDSVNITWTSALESKNVSITSDPKKLFVFEGEALTLICQVDPGSTTFWFAWYKGSIEDSVHLPKNNKQKLQLTKSEESGNYYCQASWQHLGRNITLRSNVFQAFIFPKPAGHGVAGWALTLSLFALIGLCASWIIYHFRKIMCSNLPVATIIHTEVTESQNPNPSISKQVRGAARAQSSSSGRTNQNKGRPSQDIRMSASVKKKPGSASPQAASNSTDGIYSPLCQETMSHNDVYNILS